MALEKKLLTQLFLHVCIKQRHRHTFAVLHHATSEGDQYID